MALMNMGHVLTRNDVRLARVRREAKAMISADPALGWSVLGAADLLCADYDGMRAKFRNALKFSPAERTHLNYAAALINAGFFSEACEHASVGEDPFLWKTKETIECMLYVGRVVHARAMAIRYRYRPYLEHMNPVFLDELIVSISLLERQGIREQAITAALDIAGEILRTRGLFFVNDDPFRLGGKGTNAPISYVFRVDVSESESERINEEYQQQIATHIADFSPVLVPVQFEPSRAVI